MFFDLRLFFTSALALLAIVTIASAQTSPPVRGEIEGRQSEGSSYFGESQKTHPYFAQSTVSSIRSLGM